MPPAPARVILLVDDVEQVVSIAGEYLERRLKGVQVVTFSKPQDALAWLAQSPRCDLVLSDNHMGEMDGLELLSRSREHKPHAVRALMTAYLDLAVSAQDLGAMGVHALIRKPWEWPELARFLARLLGLPAEELAAIERRGPIPFPANAFAELAASHAGVALAAPDAPEDAATAKLGHHEDAIEREEPRRAKARVDSVNGLLRVTCPCCQQEFHVEVPAPPDAAPASVPRLPPELVPATAPAPHAAPMGAHAHAGSLTDPTLLLTDEAEARRLLAYLRSRPGVAKQIRALQDRPGPTATTAQRPTDPRSKPK